MIRSKNNAYLLVLISCIYLFSSCSHRYYYVPGEGSTLALKEEKDLKASMGIGGIEGGGNNFSLQLGYSPVKHLGIQSSIFSVSKPVKNTLTSGRGFTGSLAVGSYLFLPLNPGKQEASEPITINKQLGILFDAYIGYERGNLETYSQPLSYSKFDFQKYFLQGGLFLQQGNFGFDFAFKFSHLDFISGRIHQTAAEDIIDEINTLKDNNPFNTIESTFGFHFGKEALKAYFSCTVLKTESKLQSNFSSQTTRIGIIMDLNEFIEIIKRKR